MRIIRRGLSVLFLFLILAMGIIIAGCADDPGGANKEEEVVTRGNLTGRVTRGPMCPAQRVGISCPPEPVSGVELLILTPAGQEINSVVTNDQGVYSISLPPGTYHIDLASPLAGIEFTKDLPATITITEGQETHLDVHIDTGIR